MEHTASSRLSALVPHALRWILRFFGPLIPLVILAGVVLLMHGETVSGFWRFDDPQMLDFVRHQPLLETFHRPEVWRALDAPFFTPLLTLSYAVDDALFDLRPAGFYLHHLISLCLTVGITAVRLKREQIQLVVDGDVVGTGVAARKGLLQGHLLEKSD